MTKEEAINAMEQDGHKVAHKCFPRGEWLMVHDDNFYIDEEGILFDKEEFWEIRYQQHFNDGWRIVG